MHKAGRSMGGGPLCTCLCMVGAVKRLCLAPQQLNQPELNDFVAVRFASIYRRYDVVEFTLDARDVLHGMCVVWRCLQALDLGFHLADFSFLLANVQVKQPNQGVADIALQVRLRLALCLVVFVNLLAEYFLLLALLSLVVGPYCSTRGVLGNASTGRRWVIGVILSK